MQTSDILNDHVFQEPSNHELSWNQIIQEEITNNVTTLRRNKRWSISSSYYQKPNLKPEPWMSVSDSFMFDYCQQVAQKSPFGFESLLEFHSTIGKPNRYPYTEDPLFVAFTQLKARLNTVNELKELDPLMILNPFLQVIKCGDTTGQITGVALTSIQKLISFKIIDPLYPNLNVTMAEVVNSVTRCKFEASDSASDEAVLSKILKLLSVIITSEAGKRWLDDRGVCEMVEVAFGMYFQARISDFLRKSAQECLENIVRIVFSRLSVIVQELKNPKTPKQDLHDVKEEDSVVSSLDTNRGDESELKEESYTYFKPFGLASIVELLRVLSTLADPLNRQHTDSLHRTISLNLLYTALEVGGHSLNEFISWANSKESIKKPIGFSRKSSLVDIDVDSMNINVRLTDSMETEVAVCSDAIQGTSQGNQIDVESLVNPNNDMADPLPSPMVSSTISSMIQVTHTQTHSQPSKLPSRLNSAKSSGIFTNLTNNDEKYRMREQVRLGRIALELISNDICKHLFSILQTFDLVYNNPPSWQVIILVRNTLKVLVALFQTLRRFLKFQLEYFIEWSIGIVDSGIVSWDIEDWMFEPKRNSKSFIKRDSNSQSFPSKTGEILVGEVRELVLNSLVQLTSLSSLFTELYINYDGDMTVRTNLYEELMRFLSRNSFPDATFGGPVTSVAHQTLCLDMLLGFVMGLYDEREFYHTVKGYNTFSNANAKTLSNTQNGTSASTSTSTKENTRANILKQNISKKRQLIQGSLVFNQDPKAGIAYLQEYGFLANPADASNIATFLVKNTFISKKVLGDYLSKSSNQGILNAFVSHLGFENKRIDEALRILLEKFRLPGESQLIERIMDAFSEQYYATLENTPNKPIASQTAAYILSYSVIMLHTDQHNPQVRKRMTFQDFARNNRGVNDGQDFDLEYLKEIYNAIKDKEILLPEEHGGRVGFSYKWREILHLAESCDEQGGYILPLAGHINHGHHNNGHTNHESDNTITEYNADMFISIWGPLLACFLHVFDSTEDCLVFDKVTIGIYQCASLASIFSTPVVFDYIIMSLSKLSGLVNTEQRSSSTDSLSSNPMSSLSRKTTSILEYSKSPKSQVATLLMFSLVNEFPECLNESWSCITRCLSSLFDWEFLSLPPITNLKMENIELKPLKRSVIETPPSTKKESGLFSTLTQFLTFTMEDNDQENLSLAIEKGKQVIQLCFIDSLFVLQDSGSVLGLMKALASNCWVTEKKSLSNEESRVQEKKLDPCVYYILSLVYQVSTRNYEYFESFWEVFKDLMMELMKSRDGLLLNLICIFQFRLIESIESKTNETLTSVSDTTSHSHTISDSLHGTTSDSIHGTHTNTNTLGNKLYLLILSLPKDSFPLYAEQFCLGVSLLCKSKNNASLFSSDSWEKTVGLLSSSSMIPQVMSLGLQACIDLIDLKVSVENYGECVDLLLNFPASTASMASNATPNGRLNKELLLLWNHVSVCALDRIYQFHSEFPLSQTLKNTNTISNNMTSNTLNNMSNSRFYEFWLPILSGVGQHCYHPLKEVRQHAFSLLQKGLLSIELQELKYSHSDIFETVLFPLLDELCKSELKFLDPMGMDETRMRASALLCKTFLHFLSSLSSSKGLYNLWVRILEYLQKYMSIGSNEYLHEGVLESLKNMLLVLSTQGLFQKDALPNQGDPNPNLWNITWEILVFAPFADLFPSISTDSDSSKTIVDDKPVPVLDVDVSLKTVTGVTAE